jgi:putative holliday junction resolvase
VEYFALGLDIGRKRIGVAGCDQLGMFATGLVTIDRTSLDQVIVALRPIVADRRINLLVVGIPYDLDGGMGAQAKTTRKTARAIAKALMLPIAYIDERLTSYAAEELLKAENIAPSRHKGLIDRKAAAIILQEWLTAQKTSPTNGLNPSIESDHSAGY